VLWAQDIQAVMDAWEIDRVVLVGWSYGGHAVCDYQRHYGQEKVRGVVFVDANVEIGTERAGQLVPQEAWKLFDLIGSSVAAQYREGLAYELQLLSDNISPEDYATFLGAVASSPPHIWQAMFARQTDNAQLLQEFRIPTLIVHGKRDKIFSVESSQWIADRVPGSKLLLFESGHAPFYEQASEFNQEVATFVQLLA